jgi:hypothetical protein
MLTVSRRAKEKKSYAGASFPLCEKFILSKALFASFSLRALRKNFYHLKSSFTPFLL